MGLETEESVHCPKCGQMNDPTAERCARCEGHLLIYCRTCGAKNHRAARRCVNCGTDIHRVKRKRKLKHLYLESEGRQLLLVGLVLVLAALVWVILRTRFFKQPF